MRILLVTPGLGLGGSERLTVAYAQGLADRGHDVIVMHGPPVEFKQADMPGVGLHRVAGRPSAGTFAEWIREMRAVVREFRPDVIHAQSVRSSLVVAVAAPRTPLLVTLHGIEESQERTAALLLRAGRGYVTAVSDASAAGVTRHHFAPRIDVVPPGVDVEALERGALEPTTIDVQVRRPLVVCIGRHFPVKGIDVLVEAFPQVLGSLPDAGLLLVGGGPDHEALIARVAELGMAHAVHFTGFVHSAAPYIALADLVVLPSRREGLPVAALEALALERAVIATAVGGTPDVVRPGDTGWLVSPDRPVELAQAIIEALHDPEERARRAARGRALVVERYSTRVMIDRIEKLCSELAANRKPPLRPAYVAARAYQRARASARRSGTACACSAITASPPSPPTRSRSPPRASASRCAPSPSAAPSRSASTTR